MRHPRPALIVATALLLGGAAARLPAAGTDGAPLRDRSVFPAAAAHGADTAAYDIGVPLAEWEAAGSRSSRHRISMGWGLHPPEPAAQGDPWGGISFHGYGRAAQRLAASGHGPDPGRLRAPGARPCCAPVDTATALERHPASPAAQPRSATVFVFAAARRKGLRGLNVDLEHGWKLHAGTRKLAYGSALRTRLEYLTVERDWGGLRASWSLQVERVGLDLAPHHALRLDYRYAPDGSVGLALIQGRKYISMPPLGIVDAPVRGVALHGQRAVGRDWTLTFEAAWDDHGGIPSRHAARAGFSRRF